jgi:hypothetical protein
MLAGVNESFLKSLRQLVDIPKILIIPVPFFCKKGVKTVVEILIPLGIQTISSFSRWIDDPGIIEIAFRDDRNRALEEHGLPVNSLPYFG